MDYFAYYSLNTLLVVVLMLMMIIVAQGSGVFEKKRSRVFVSGFIMLANAAVFEWLGVYLDGAAERTRALHVFAKTLELSLAPFIPAVLVMSVDQNRHQSWLHRILTLNVVLEFFSAFNGLVFYVDADNYYRHGPIYPVYYVFLLLSFSYMVIATYLINKRNQRWRGVLMVVVSIMLIAGTVPHLLRKELHYDWLMCSLASIMYYLYSFEISAVTDPLTGVFNRSLYEKRIAGSVRNGTVLVAFDVDNFKSINDKLGHVAGDDVLRAMALAIRENYSRFGDCYRVGGDEFIVLLRRKGCFVEELNYRLEKLLDEKRKTDPNLPTVSIGYGIYMGDIQATVQEADRRMYEYKRRAKPTEN